MPRADTWSFFIGRLRIGGGATFYPYQIACGVTLRYWPDMYAPNIRIHLGPFKVWFFVMLKRGVGA